MMDKKWDIYLQAMTFKFMIIYAAKHNSGIIYSCKKFSITRDKSRIHLVEIYDSTTSFMWETNILPNGNSSIDDTR